MNLKSWHFVLAIVVLTLPMFAVDCGYRRHYACREFMAIELNFNDSISGISIEADSILLHVVNAPNPDVQAKSSDKYTKLIYLNPQDSTIIATLDYHGKSDTVWFQYQNRGVVYQECNHIYNLDFTVRKLNYTCNNIYPLDGKIRQMDSPHLFYTLYNSQLVLYMKK